MGQLITTMLFTIQALHTVFSKTFTVTWMYDDNKECVALTALTYNS